MQPVFERAVTTGVGGYCSTSINSHADGIVITRDTSVVYCGQSLNAHADGIAREMRPSYCSTSINSHADGIVTAVEGRRVKDVSLVV